MAPGKHTFIYKNDRPWPNDRLGTAAIVGHTTDTTTRLWFRTGMPGDFIALIFEYRAIQSFEFIERLRQVPLPPDELPSEAQQIPFSINDWSSDTTIVLDISNLEPDTEYCYGLYWSSAKPDEQRIYLGHDAIRRFRTMPAEESAAPVSFGFYSCHRPFGVGLFGKTHLVNLELWDMFAKALDRHSGRESILIPGESSASDLRFVIGGGDQVYVDGVKTLDIWKFLDKNMRIDEDGQLLPTKEDMVSWYRDIYRGYWGFPAFQHVHANYPTYMIWDDHEIHDGWGSYYLDKDEEIIKYFLPGLADSRRGLSVDQGRELVGCMFEAATQVYTEYQHGHNPSTPPGQFDYGFYVGPCAFYVLDSRSKRDLGRQGHRILDKEQHERFEAWLDSEDTKTKQFLFVVSTVPVFHLRPLLGSDAIVSKLGNLSDDLRDSWENELHRDERSKLLSALFSAAARGQRVAILSGDVHVAAAFKIRNDEGNVIHQLTSSAITYNVSRALGVLLGLGVPDKGKTDDGFEYERLALYRDSNFSIVRADSEANEIVFQLYGRQSGTAPERELDMKFEKMLDELGGEPALLSHSIAKVRLNYK